MHGSSSGVLQGDIWILIRFWGTKFYLVDHKIQSTFNNLILLHWELGISPQIVPNKTNCAIIYEITLA